jgi:hypothetical protein
MQQSTPRLTIVKRIPTFPCLPSPYPFGIHQIAVEKNGFEFIMASK